VRIKLNNYMIKFLGILLSTSLVIYLLSPINFASGAGLVTTRSISMSSSAPGFTPTTLAADITSTSQTTMTVTSSANYPPPPFVISLGAYEAIEVTAISGTTWTIVRGYDGTNISTYTSGTSVGGSTTYNVSFVPASPSIGIEAIVIDFCTDSPIYNSSTCYTPTGMNIGNGYGGSGGTSTVRNVSGIPTPLFGAKTGINSSRNAFLAWSGGTAYTPFSPTTLNSAITNSQTTISVASSASYPAATTANPSSWFYVSIPTTGETMQVTNVSGTTWTVTRGALGTAATSVGTCCSVFLSQPPIAFSMFGNTNPTVIGPLYARIYTFSDETYAIDFAEATSSSGTLSYPYSSVASYNIDAGGAALEIVNTLTVNAKVQEYLQFCIYTAFGTSTGCNFTGSTVTLGNNAGILSLVNAYVDSSTRFDVATNASGYAAITFTGLPPSDGSFLVENSSLSGTGTVATSAYSSTVGTNQFGLCAIAAGALYQAVNYSSANLSFPSSAYNNINCPTTQVASSTYSGSAQFGLNIAQAGSVYGDLLALQKPGTGSTGLISFLGNISPGTPAGSYSTTFNFVASGTY